MPIMNTVIQGGGTTPTGTKSITANGVYDVTDFASADVQVPTTAPAHYIEKTVDANGKLINDTNIINLNGATDIGNYVFVCAYYDANFPANTSIDLSNLTTISGMSACERMFYNCRGITSVDLSGLTTISGYNACFNMFNYCQNLTSVNLSSLTTISGNNGCYYMFDHSGITTIDLSSLTTISGNNGCANMFNSCQNLTSVNLSSLTTINAVAACQGMFAECHNLTSIDLSGLTIISGNSVCQYMLNGCYKLESVKFGGLKSTTFSSAVNQFQYLFNATTGSQVTNGCTVHFPSNFDPADPNHTFDASTLTGYPTFGGNASYIHVAFDLPATE